MSAILNEISSLKYKSSTVFLVYFIVNGYIPKGTPKEVVELIVLFTYSRGDYKNAGTFNPSIAPGWETQINVSFPENKINKIANIKMAHKHSAEIPVYLPYVVEQNWSIKRLKREILKMNGIDGDLHTEYTLWVWRRYLLAKDDPLWKKDTEFESPDVDDDMKYKRMYKVGGKGYCGLGCEKASHTVRRKLKSREKYILSKQCPQHREQGTLYGWEGNKKYYTESELIKLWGGKDLTRDSMANRSYDSVWESGPTWHPSLYSGYH